jgi:prepilin-type N-terminal cleavage/methylation domain-containing protein
MKQRAFTLIELLVVIAIIAILAAILFPVFAQAKLAAKKASDLSQVKQVGLGIAIYLNDYDDTYPLSTVEIYGNWYGGGWNGHVRWSGQEVTQPYIKNLAIYKSTGDSATLGGVTAESWWTIYPQMSPLSRVGVNSYYGNGIPIGTKHDDDWAFNPAEIPPSGQVGLFGPGPDGNISASPNDPDYLPVGTASNASRVQFPSELIMFNDGSTDMDHYWAASSGCANTTNTEMNYCEDDWDSTWRPLWFLVNYYDQAPITTVLREYSGTANYVMADTSAKAFHPGQLVEANLYLNQHRWIVSPGQ